MTYAQIKDGFVKNIIALDDTDLLSIFEDGFDYLVDITMIDPQPGIGWGYDGVNFIVPTPIVETLPLDPENWDIGVPETNNEALDRIANVVSSNGSIPIP